MPNLVSILAVSVVAIAIFSGSASAQSGVSWSSACDEAQCTLSRTVTEASTERRVATVLVLIRASSPTHLVGAAVPLGVALNEGIRLTVPDQRIDISFDVCLPDGCRGLQPVSEEVLNDISGEL